MTETTARHTVLLVDDTPANLELVVESLELEGYEVLVALDGEEALRRAEWVLPDLILLDIMMPGIDGFEVCQRLKASPATAEIPVVFMTALNATQHKVEGFAAGAVDYLTKPLQIDEVRARVNTHLRLRALYRQLEEKNAALEKEVAERQRYAADLRVSHERLRELTAHREQEREVERKRVAWRMHEELGQYLATIRFGLTSLRAGGTFDDPRTDEEVHSLTALLDQTLHIIRGLVSELRPPALDLGIDASLEWLAEDFTRRTGLFCEWHDASGAPSLDEWRALALFRAAEEALESTARRAGVRWVKMTLDRDGDRCLLTVRDDGRRDAPAELKPLGLLDAQERLAIFGGEIAVTDGAVVASLPLEGR